MLYIHLSWRSLGASEILRGTLRVTPLGVSVTCQAIAKELTFYRGTTLILKDLTQWSNQFLFNRSVGLIGRNNTRVRWEILDHHCHSCYYYLSWRSLSCLVCSLKICMHTVSVSALIKAPLVFIVLPVHSSLYKYVAVMWSKLLWFCESCK